MVDGGKLYILSKGDNKYVVVLKTTVCQSLVKIFNGAERKTQ